MLALQGAGERVERHGGGDVRTVHHGGPGPLRDHDAPQHDGHR